MFHDLDEVLRQLLVRELPVKNGEIDIAFDQPKREWSARINRPTINLFLHNVHENLQLRQSQQWMIEQNPTDGTAIQRRTPVRLDLHYLLTVWATDPDDEHSLLARAMMALFRYPDLPKDLLPESLQGQSVPIRLKVGQQETTLRSLADIWSALDNEVRPAITIIITLSLDPYAPLVTPIVRSTQVRIGQSADPGKARKLIEASEPTVYWTIGGTIQTDKPLEQLQLTLLERGLNVPIQEEGWFAITNLRAGDYTLEVKVDGGKPTRHKITVPSPDYDLQV